MLTPEQKARLNPDELVVAEKWEREKEERAKLIKSLRTATGHGRRHVMRKILKSPDRCEHGRSIWSPCSACHQIEMKLYPELYDENGEPIDEGDCPGIPNDVA